MRPERLAQVRRRAGRSFSLCGHSKGPAPTAGVYQIVCTATGDSYIGSTTDLGERFRGHRGGIIRQRHHVHRINSLAAAHGTDCFVFHVLWVPRGRATRDIGIRVYDAEMSAIEKLKPSLNLFVPDGRDSYGRLVARVRKPGRPKAAGGKGKGRSA